MKQKVNVKIIQETPDYLVIHKPAGIVVHPPFLPYGEETVVGLVKKQYPEIQRVGDDPALRPGVVHRLDQEVSGVMIIARTQSGFDWIKTEFKEHRVVKKYIGLVYGRVARVEGDITFPLKKRKARIVATPKKGKGKEAKAKEAVTHFEVLAPYQHYTLLSLIPKTGRTHQLRVHCQNFGHSIVGDTRYCHPQYKNRKAFRKFVITDRIFLHASYISFKNLDSVKVEYSVPLPSELQAFLDTLSSKLEARNSKFETNLNDLNSN